MGKLVELSKTESIFENPKNPYTAMLLNSVAGLGQRTHFDQSGFENYSPDMWDEYEGQWLVEDDHGYLVR